MKDNITPKNLVRIIFDESGSFRKSFFIKLANNIAKTNVKVPSNAPIVSVINRFSPNAYTNPNWAIKLRTPYRIIPEMVFRLGK